MVARRTSARSSPRRPKGAPPRASLAALVSRLRLALAGRACSRVEAYGRALVRPDDDTWTIVGVRRRAEIVEVLLRPADGSVACLRLRSPSGLTTTTGDGLTIKRASSVRWPGLALERRARALVRIENGERAEAPLPAAPALRLSWSRRPEA